MAKPESTTSIKVRWGPVHWKKIGGKITHYILEVYNVSKKIGDYNVSGSALEYVEYVVNGLQVNSNYSARVQAVTALGAGPFSGFENTTTHQPGMDFKWWSLCTAKVRGSNFVSLNFLFRLYLLVLEI